ncbi:MFS transporter [Kitasatospora sp. NPDC057015]|uniref:MFS transporter n=1 Tax=Kitasatospora sp. NPDC057015 TaxID=3346001 RepID=UPI003642F166
MSPVTDRVRRTGARALGGLPPAFWWLWASTLVNRLGTFAVPFLTLYLTGARGHSAAVAGLVAAASGVGGMVGALLGGAAADRFGCRPALLTAQLGTAAAAAALGLSSGDAPLAASAVLLGLCGGAARPAAAALMAGLLGPGDRIRAFSLDYWAMNLGFSVSVLLAGLAVGAGYPVLFLADAFATLLAAGVVLLRVPEPERAPQAERAAGRPSGEQAVSGQAESGPVREPGRRGAGGLGEVLADRPFLGCAVLFAVVAAILQQMTTTLPVDMAAGGLTPAACGAVIAVNGVLVCLLQVPVGGLLAGRSPFGLLALSAALCGVGFGLTALAGSAAAYALTVAVWTVGEVVAGPVGLEVTARFATARTRARYQGVSAFAWSVGGVLAGAVGGWTYDRHGGGALWAGCAGAGLAAAAGFLVAGRYAPGGVRRP